MRRLLVAVVLLAAASTSCRETTAAIVVKLGDYSLTASPKRAEEGNVIVDLDNAGPSDHEIVLVRGDDPAALPVGGDGRVDVSKVVVADQVERFPAGRWRIMFPDTRYGSYVLFCNLITPGPDGKPTSHYQRGMRDTIEIRQIAPAQTEGP